MRQVWRGIAVAAACFCASSAWGQIEAQPSVREAEEAQRKADEAQVAPRLTKPPKLVYQVQPKFPDEARMAGRSGTTIMRMVIDEEGYVSRVDVLQSAGAEDLDWAAMGAVANFVFEPAEVDDVPAPISLDYKQTFAFQEQRKEVAVEPEPVMEPDAPPQAPQEAAPAVEKPAGPLNFLGLVRESGTKAALADAEIVIILEAEEGGEEPEPIAVTTGKDGRFEVRGVPEGKHVVRVSATGYEQLATVEDFNPKEAVKAIYFLPRRSYNKFETVVTSKRAQKEVSRISLSREEISQIPGTFGDPIRVVENLPGMQRAPALGGALLVRGANPADTGVYLDGVPVPVLYHFLGLTSVVNAEFLETIDFYPGGFGARFGRATAGIVDVKTRDLKLRRCRGTAKVDLIDSGFFFGCPLTLWGEEVDSDAPSWRRITFAGAARRSYLDALIPLFTSTFLPGGSSTLTAAPVYWDYQGKLEYRPMANHTFTLFTFGSQDTLKVVASGSAEQAGITLRTNNAFHRAMAAWEWRMHPRLSNRFAPWVGYELNQTGFGSSNNLNGAIDVAVTSWGLRDDLKYNVFEGLNLNAGVDVISGNFGLVGDLPFSGELNAFPRVIPRIQSGGIAFNEVGSGTAYGAYAEAEIGPFAGFKLIPGFRADIFEFERTVNVSAGPRMAARWEIIPGTTFKGAWGVYEKQSSPQTRLETLGNPRLWPERSIHHVIGVEQKLTSKLGVDFQLFWNAKNSLVVNSNRVKSVNAGQADLEVYSNDGVGNAYGAEFLLRHNLGNNFFGWIAYTLMRSENREKSNSAFNLTQYDQTHILTVVGQYKVPFHFPFREWARTGRLPRSGSWNTAWAILSGDWSFGGRFRLVTGNPDTPYISSVHDLDTDSFRPKSDGFRSKRLPTFNQLDIRVDYKIAFDNLLLNFYVDLLNATNAQNAEFRIWDYRYAGSAWLALLPLVPVLGMTAEF